MAANKEFLFDRDKFRVLLKKSGLLQSDFAKVVGCTASAINAIYHGRYDPSFTTICRIADALHCNVADLLNDELVVFRTEQAGSLEQPKTADGQTEIGVSYDQKEALAIESLSTAIELIKIARDMLGEVRTCRDGKKEEKTSESL